LQNSLSGGFWGGWSWGWGSLTFDVFFLGVQQSSNGLWGFSLSPEGR